MLFIKCDSISISWGSSSFSQCRNSCENISRISCFLLFPSITFEFLAWIFATAFGAHKETRVREEIPEVKRLWQPVQFTEFRFHAGSCGFHSLCYLISSMIWADSAYSQSIRVRLSTVSMSDKTAFKERGDMIGCVKHKQFKKRGSHKYTVVVCVWNSKAPWHHIVIKVAFPSVECWNYKAWRIE